LFAGETLSLHLTKPQNGVNYPILGNFVFSGDLAMKTDSFIGVNHHRRQFIGGSDARIITGADEAALLRLWQEKRGEIETQDLSGDLLVQLGTVTERLNRHWYEKNTGQVVADVQRQVFHAVHRWMAATLDGRIEATGAVFEAKFMLPWNFSEEAAAEKHMAQLQHVRRQHP
jgi:predicted phage-related endonuclease